jgi:hypothetical protein
VKRRPLTQSSELLSPKAAIGWEAEAELIRRVEGAGGGDVEELDVEGLGHATRS